MDSSICLAILKAGVLDLLFNKLNNEKKSCSEQGVAELGSRNKSSKSEFVDIDSRKIPLEYWSVILPLCGTQVREINATWNIANKIPYRLILNECPYLESIQFNVNNNNWLEIISLLLEAKSLKSVYLHISKDCKVSVDILKVLRRLPKLTKLFLHGLDPKEVYQLQKLIHLEDLSLSLRKDSPPINIFEVLSSLKNLHTLHISNIKILENHYSSLSELEHLEIVSCHTYWMLPHFPKLKSLRFRNNLNYSPDFRLSSWILRHSNTLEFLELRFQTKQYDNIHFEEEDLLKTVRSCKNLRTLHLGNYFYWDFVEPFMDAVKANGGFSLENPLQIVFNNVEEVKPLFYKSPSIGLIYIRNPTPFERCVWSTLPKNWNFYELSKSIEFNYLC